MINLSEPNELIEAISLKIEDLKSITKKKVINTNIAERIIRKLDKGYAFLKKYKNLRDIESGFLIIWSVVNEIQLFLTTINFENSKLIINENNTDVNCKYYFVKNVLFNNKNLFVYNKSSSENEYFRKATIRHSSFQIQVYMFEMGLFSEIEQIYFAYLTEHRNTLDITHSDQNRIIKESLHISHLTPRKYIFEGLEYSFYMIQFFKCLLNKEKFFLNINLKNMKVEDHYIVGNISSKFIKESKSKEDYDTKKFYFFVMEVVSSIALKQEAKVQVKNSEVFQMFEVGERIQAFVNFNLFNEINNIRAWKVIKIITENEVLKILPDS